MPTNFTVFRKDRISKIGGGVLIAVNNSITCKQLSSPNELEVVTICICSTKPIILSLVYSPPNASYEYHSGLVQLPLTLY